MLATLRNHRLVLYAALALGLCADYLFQDRALGISAPLFVALALMLRETLAAGAGREPTRANRWLAVAALFFAVCLAWRASSTLTALNTLALLGLLALDTVLYCSASLSSQSPGALVARLVGGWADAAWLPLPLAADAARALPREGARARRLRPIGCGLLLALPVLGLFTLLLASADTVFASYVEQLFSFNLPFDLRTLIGHAFFIAMMAWVSAGALAVALLGDARSAVGSAFAVMAGTLTRIVYIDPADAEPTDELPSEGDTQRLRLPRRALLSLGWVEACTILVAVDLLFGSFMAIQGAYFFGGLDTLARTGMTYAEYARRGFFELLAVACLALGLLCGLAIITRRPGVRERRSFNIASTAMIALVLGLLASAFQRMALYEAAYGYTELRIYTHSFMIWLAVLLGLFLLALLRQRAQLFVVGGLVLAVLYLAVLNVVNPDALIVRENIARLHLPVNQQIRSSEEVDAQYLTQLSSDAVPTLVGALGQLDPDARRLVSDQLALRYGELVSREQNSGWPGWHLGHARARWALEQAGLTEPPKRE